MKQSGLLIVCFLFYCMARSQNIGIGADALYNFQTESVGAGARVNIHPNEKLSLTPQFTYYFGFNKIHEYYLGLGVEYKVVPVKQFDLYGVGQAAYNDWLNYSSSSMEGAQPNNWNFELGAGLTNRKCLRPFLEYRYNLKFRETHLRLGLLYVIGCNGGNGGGKYGHGSGHGKLCPAYD